MTTYLRHAFGLGILLLAGTAQAAVVTKDLYARSGSTTLPDTRSFPILGYTLDTSTNVTVPGGPVIDVNQGDVVTVTLHNLLNERTGLLFQGQALVPDTVGVDAAGSISYTFTAAAPGTFLYEAGPLANAQHQVAMGLHGALVVRPTTAGQAYDSTAMAFTDEAVLVLSELDPALNGRANPASFDMRSFAPRYFLINGKAYPGTAPITSAAGNRVLLRYVNAGVQHHSMTLLGMQQTVVAKDGSPLTHPGLRVAETIAPGQTMDAIATVPAGATGQFALMDGTLNLFNNRAQGFGGMLTFLSVGGTPPPAGPTVTALSLLADFATLTATITAASGGNVMTAQYWIDSGAPSSVPFSPPVATANLSAPVPPLAPGSHVVSVRGQDVLGTWGAARTLAFAVDTAGPATTGLVLAPNPGNGSVDVALSATGDDRAAGNSNIAAAEYFINAATPPPAPPPVTTRGTPMTVAPSSSPGPGASVAALTATIPAAGVNALSQGPYLVSVRSQDALGNWGAIAAANFLVDKTGPVTSSVVATPNPNNGAQAVNSNTAVVRVTATLSDTASRIAAGEGFIDTAGAPGTGFQFVPVDGDFGSLSEAASADIPLSTINALPVGNHAILVRGKDVAGNWGSTSSVVLLIDKAAPALNSIALSPTTAIIAEAVTLTAIGATDPPVGGLASGVTGGQYWFDGTTTPPANATSFTGTSTTLSASTGGVHTVRARVRDGAGNWSPVRSATLTVPSAVNDARAITANNNATQTSDANAAAGVLANDLPVGLAGRTATLASAPVRIAGTGTGSITVTCQGGTGNVAATPAINGNTVCTNGAYRVTVNGVGNNGNARAASKRGTYSFTYTESLNGKTTPAATVTITVN